jgi:hypothetical protein
VQTQEAAEAEMRARVAALPAEQRLQLAARYQEAACEPQSRSLNACSPTQTKPCYNRMHHVPDVLTA